MSVSRDCQVQVRFYLPPPELRAFFTTFYFVEIAVPDGGRAADRLHPEWANLRFYAGEDFLADCHDGTQLTGTSFAATGPSSKAVRFEVGTTRMWGIGLLPLGWAKFVSAPAADLADAVLDGHGHRAFACFAPLAAAIFAEPDEQAELARITNYFLSRLAESVPDEKRINAIHAALLDPEVANVGQLVDHAGIGQRTVERICDRAFGFPPKLLLRRQRFMRSLAQYMLDPSLKWIGAMDGHYHDQAQFVRDFRQFMGMTPRAYGALDKPILNAVMRERARCAGGAVQTLDGPGGRPRSV